MKKLEMVEKRRKDILKEMLSIRSMHRGTINEQFFEAKIKDGKETVLRGPYYVLSRNREGRTESKRLKKGPELEQANKDIAAYKRFDALCREYEELTQQLGELEREPGAERDVKKGLKSSSKKRRR